MIFNYNSISKLIMLCCIITLSHSLCAMELSHDNATTDFSTKPIFYGMCKKQSTPKKSNLSVATNTNEDKPPYKRVITSDNLLSFYAEETLPQDPCSTMHTKLSIILTNVLYDSSITPDEKIESLKMLKHEAQEMVKIYLQSGSRNILQYSDLVTRSHRLIETLEQEVECRALQAECLSKEPNLDTLD